MDAQKEYINIADMGNRLWRNWHWQVDRAIGLGKVMELR